MHWTLDLLLSLLGLALALAVGAYLGQLLEQGGFTARLAKMLGPILRLGRVSPQMLTAWSLAFVSGHSAGAYLSTCRDNGSMNRKELLGSSLLNAFPSQLVHLPSQALSMGFVLGWKITVAFFATQLLAGMARTITVLWWLGLSPKTTPAVQAEAPQKDLKQNEKPKPLWRRALTRSRSSLIRIAAIALPLAALVGVLEHYGCFGWIRPALEHTPFLADLAPQAPALAALNAVSLQTAVLSAGNMLHSMVLDERTICLCLLIGSTLAAPLRSLRHGLSTPLALYGPWTGALVITASQVLRAFFLALGIVALAFIWPKVGGASSSPIQTEHPQGTSSSPMKTEHPTGAGSSRYSPVEAPCAPQ